MVFHWSLSNIKSSQVSRILLSILTVLNNAVVLMVTTRPLTSMFSSLFNSPLVTVPNAPITIGIILFTNPSARAGYGTRSFFKRSLTGLNSEFSVSKTSCLTKAGEPSLSYYLHIDGGRIIGFIPFPRVLVLCEMQSVSSRIWLVSPCSFPTTITITPWAPPNTTSTSMIGIIVTSMFHVFFFSSRARSRYLSFIIVIFIIISLLARFWH